MVKKRKPLTQKQIDAYRRIKESGKAAEWGRLGGLETAKRGPEFYREIRKKRAIYRQGMESEE